MVEPGSGALEPSSPLENTTVLLSRARGGDAQARDALFARFLPVLKRWAHRRLPMSARDLSDTDDLVQVTLVRALNRLGEFEPRREGAFLAYLRTILMNAVRDELRRSLRRGVPVPEDEAAWGASPSELEALVNREKLERYERGLARLVPDQREAVLLRLEFGYSHAEIAEALGRPSADAARMVVARALVSLAEAIDEPDA
jgi:RNA polymerase sigma-70 factor (ECF subfamily)